MSRLTRIVAVASALVFVLGMSSVCATKKKAPAKKPAAKPAPHYVKGTTQLKGEYAEFGATYTLGKDDPMNITLKSAEYTMEPVKIGEYTYTPKAEEKLIVFHMTYHNPQPQERFTRWDSFTFTVVDPEDKNHDGLAALGMEKDKSDCSMNFKPAQKVDVYGVMAVPGKGEMPKLIIKASDELVLRYNLKGKVKGLAAPFADPADSTGATVLDKIPVKMNEACPVGVFNVKVTNAEYNTASTMGETELNEGEKFLVVTAQIRNDATDKQFLRWDTLSPMIFDTDGVQVADCADVFQKSKDRSFGSDVEPGQELTLRYIFKVPNDTSLKALSMNYSECRPFLFDLSSVN